jgi:hypothetical protein
MVFEKIQTDLRGVDQYLAAQPELGEDDREGFSAVARIFDGEPIGVFSYELRGGCK